MQDETNQNTVMPQTPADAVNSVNPAPQAPVTVVSESPIVSPQETNEAVSSPPLEVSPQIPQNQDKSDAMTYPLGSQNAQPGAVPAASVPVEDHRTILDRIIGIFKGKKDQPEKAQPNSIDQTPTNTTPPIGL